MRLDDIQDSTFDFIVFSQLAFTITYYVHFTEIILLNLMIIKEGQFSPRNSEVIRYEIICHKNTSGTDWT